MKKITIILTALFAVLVFHSCYYDKEELLYGNNNNSCDTLTVSSYTKNVVPLLDQYCYSCHKGSFPSGNIAMGTYTTDRAIAVNGKLYGSISHASGFSPMPQGLPKFNNCQLSTVKLWIDAGAPNN